MQLELVNRNRSPLGIGAAVSVALHLAIVLAVALAYTERPERGRLVDEFVTFLLPPDQLGSDPSPDVPWQAGGGAEEEAGDDEGPATTGAGPLPEGGEGPDSAGAMPSAPTMSFLGDTVLTEFEVDSTVQRYPWTAAPAYPSELLAQAVEGSVQVRYVVDTTGFVDTTTFSVLGSTHPAFARAVRRALPNMRFRPAVRRGEKVRQLVEQSFTFQVTRRDTTRLIPP